MEPEEYVRTAEAEGRHFWFRELRWIWKGLLRRAGRADASALRVLDAGCGTGGNLAALDGARSAVGVDASPIALRLARPRTGAPLVRGSILALPFREAAFDLVLCMDVIYHRGVADDVAALREIRRCLAPGGLAVVNVPAFESLRSAHDRAVHTARRYDRATLGARLRSAGLTPLHVLYWNGLLLAPEACLRWLRRRGGNRSDIAVPPEPLNAILSAIGSVDAAAALRGLLPAGLSVAAVARRGP